MKPDPKILQAVNELKSEGKEITVENVKLKLKEAPVTPPAMKKAAQSKRRPKVHAPDNQRAHDPTDDEFKDLKGQAKSRVKLSNTRLLDTAFDRMGRVDQLPSIEKAKILKVVLNKLAITVGELPKYKNYLSVLKQRENVPPASPNVPEE